MQLQQGHAMQVAHLMLHFTVLQCKVQVYKAEQTLQEVDTAMHQ